MFTFNDSVVLVKRSRWVFWGENDKRRNLENSDCILSIPFILSGSRNEAVKASWLYVSYTSI